MPANGSRALHLGRAFAQRVLPRPMRVAIRNVPTVPARFRFAAARPADARLDEATLHRMQNAFPPFQMTPYDPDSLLSRGQTRAHELLRLGAGAEARSFLELGCWDGMVLCGLHGLGRTVVGIDFRPEGFDARAREAGVTFHVMDAAQLEFDDASFDFVYSYDCFEHFADPRRVLSEAARVTRPGGTIYIVFGPLYLSPWGAHLVKQIRVPYCHLLFGQDTLARYATTRLGETLDFDAVNRFGVREHRAILRRQETCLEVLSYREGRNTRFLGLVRRFPGLFRDCTDCFDDLIVERVEVLYRRREDVLQ